MLPEATFPSAGDSLTWFAVTAPVVTTVSHCCDAARTGACTSIPAAEAGRLVVFVLALRGKRERMLPTWALPTTTSKRRCVASVAAAWPGATGVWKLSH